MRKFTVAVIVVFAAFAVLLVVRAFSFLQSQESSATPLARTNATPSKQSLFSATGETAMWETISRALTCISYPYDQGLAESGIMSIKKLEYKVKLPPTFNFHAHDLSLSLRDSLIANTGDYFSGEYAAESYEFATYCSLGEHDRLYSSYGSLEAVLKQEHLLAQRHGPGSPPPRSSKSVEINGLRGIQEIHTHMDDLLGPVGHYIGTAFLKDGVYVSLYLDKKQRGVDLSLENHALNDKILSTFEVVRVTEVARGITRYTPIVVKIIPNPSRIGSAVTITGDGFTKEENEIVLMPAGPTSLPSYNIISVPLTSSDGENITFTFSPGNFRHWGCSAYLPGQKGDNAELCSTFEQGEIVREIPAEAYNLTIKNAHGGYSEEVRFEIVSE